MSLHCFYSSQPSYVGGWCGYSACGESQLSTGSATATPTVTAISASAVGSAAMCKCTGSAVSNQSSGNQTSPQGITVNCKYALLSEGMPLNIPQLTTVLDLSDTSLRAVSDAAFTELVSLIELDLSGNMFDELPLHAFDGLSSLRTLRIMRSQLTTLPSGVFSPLTALNVLDLSGSGLLDFPLDLFSAPIPITELYLSNVGGLADLISDGQNAEQFHNVSQLILLDISKTSIIKIDFHVLNWLTNLTTLNVSNNSLRALTGLDHFFLPNFVHFITTGNPLQCDTAYGLFFNMTCASTILSTTRNDYLCVWNCSTTVQSSYTVTSSCGLYSQFCTAPCLNSSGSSTTFACNAANQWEGNGVCLECR